MTPLAPSAPRVKVIISAYNYHDYLEAAVQSVLAQTHPVDQIIIVDDGSTDGTDALGARLAEAHQTVTYLRKENGGQLSCFNAVVDRVEDEDLVFFLDADDLYHPGYVAYVVANYDRNIDFYYSAFACFEATPQPDTKEPNDPVQKDGILLPLTSAITRATMHWIGSPTSALVVTGYLYRRLLPYSFYKEWRVRADDVLVFGASIVGASKLYLPTARVHYREHGSNNFHRQQIDTPAIVKRKLYLQRLKTAMCRKADLSEKPRMMEVVQEIELLDDRTLIQHDMGFARLAKRNLSLHLNKRYRRSLNRVKALQR